jgi:hypothetical protein
VKKDQRNIDRHCNNYITNCEHKERKADIQREKMADKHITMELKGMIIRKRKRRRPNRQKKPSKIIKEVLFHLPFCVKFWNQNEDTI